MSAEPTFGLGGHHLALRELARQVVRDQVTPHAAEVDAASAFPERSLAALVAARLHAVTLPAAYGGEGGDHLAGVVVAEEVARGCATTQQVAGANELFALPLLLSGDDELCRRYLPRVAAGGWLARSPCPNPTPAATWRP